MRTLACYERRDDIRLALDLVIFFLVSGLAFSICEHIGASSQGLSPVGEAYMVLLAVLILIKTVWNSRGLINRPR